MKRLFWSFCGLILFSFFLCAEQEQWPVPFKEFPSPGQKIAVILGAGPAGLFAANIILEAGLHDQIIIVEKRATFSRFNLVNFFPDSWPMLNKMRVAEDFKKIGKNVEVFSLYFDHFDKPLVDLEMEESVVPQEFDYRGPLTKIFEQPKAGFMNLNLADLQNQLAMSLAQHPKVFFVHGTSEFLKQNNELKYGISIKLSNNFSYNLEPDLVVVAEGAHSEGRAQLAIDLKPRQPLELWCSGSVSLGNSCEKHPKVTQVFDATRKNQSSMRTFGIFNVIDSELFLNGQAFPEESVDDCLIRNAKILLDSRLAKRSPAISGDYSGLRVSQKSQDIIAFQPSKAERFSSGENVILFGDAAGFATPKGGVGLSLLTTVYPQALFDLLSNWAVSERAGALARYEKRIEEIVDFWHAKNGLVNAD